MHCAEKWENGKAFTWPVVDGDDVHGRLAARKVHDQRGQTPVAAGPSAHRDLVEKEMVAPLAQQLHPQVVRGAAVVLERAPASVISDPISVQPQVPDRPHRRRLGALAEQAADAASWSFLNLHAAMETQVF